MEAERKVTVPNRIQSAFQVAFTGVTGPGSVIETVGPRMTRHSWPVSRVLSWLSPRILMLNSTRF
jgi:hypothetical protein